jgi:hypothetical protein
MTYPHTVFESGTHVTESLCSVTQKDFCNSVQWNAHALLFGDILSNGPEADICSNAANLKELKSTPSKRPVHIRAATDAQRLHPYVGARALKQ